MSYVAGGVVAQRVGRRTCVQEVAGSTLGLDVAVQRLYARCSRSYTPVTNIISIQIQLKIFIDTLAA